MKTAQSGRGSLSLVARIRHGARGLRIGRPKARMAMAVGSFGIGSIAIGAFFSVATYIGTLAVARLVVRRLAVGNARITRLRIDELEVGKLQLLDQAAAVSNGHVGQPTESVVHA